MPVGKEIKVLVLSTLFPESGKHPHPKNALYIKSLMLCMLRALCFSHFITIFKRVFGMSKVLEFDVL